MARNEEKAQSMLNRFVTMKKNQGKDPEQRRPHLASECTSISECEKWRSQVIKEISKHVSMIQNGSLGEHKIRDLNDTLNKFLREKSHWERQIKILGGADYGAGPRVVDLDGRAALGVHGYYYFGAAKELPGVRELFEKTTVAEAKKKNKGEIVKAIDPDYYGYRDDDDELLTRLESQHQQKLIKAAIAAYAASGASDADSHSAPADSASASASSSSLSSSSAAASSSSSSSSVDGAVGDGGGVFRSHVDLPSNELIKALIANKKKRDIAAKYGTL